jgi:hypothetical protein
LLNAAFRVEPAEPIINWSLFHEPRLWNLEVLQIVCFVYEVVVIISASSEPMITGRTRVRKPRAQHHAPSLISIYAVQTD